MPSTLTRRALVERSLTAAAAGGIGATAGCLDFDLLGGDGVGLSTAMRRLAPAPAALPEGFDYPGGHYPLQGWDLTALRATPDRVRNLAGRTFSRRLESLGLAPDAVAATVGVGQRTTVARADYDGESVTAQLEDRGFERVGTHRDVRVYRGELSVTDADEPHEILVGIDGSYVVVVRLTGWRDAIGEAMFRTTIDAGRGDEARYAETDEAVEALLDHLNPDLAITVRGTDTVTASEARPEYGRFEGQIGLATHSAVDDGALTLRRVSAFEHESRLPGEETLERFYENGRFGSGDIGYERRETRRDGRILEFVYETDVTDLPTGTPTA